jgi:hypothetical protein
VVVGVDRGGRELWRTPMVGSMGAPAARGGVVAVPNAYQNLSLLDGKTGRELARVRATDEQINFVRALPAGFFYGGMKGATLLDEKSASGARATSSLIEAHLGSERIRTFYYWDGYEQAQVDYSAFDRNRLLWRAEPRAGGAGFSDGLAILHSYRYFFAFDAAEGRMRWAYAHPRVDVVSAEACGPTVVFASADGDVGALDAASGALHAVHKTGLSLAGATFDADGYPGGPIAETPDLKKTLERIVWDPDARFNAVKLFAVESLGALDDSSTALLRVVLSASAPPAVARKAGELLVAKKDAAVLPRYLEALAQHYDFLDERQPRGVEVLARAVAALGAQQAAPFLAAQLDDPETPQATLKDLAAALGALGGPEALTALTTLLLTYRADPMFLADPEPLTLAAEALAQHGGAAERRAIAFAADEPHTLPSLASVLKRLLKTAESARPQRR